MADTPQVQAHVLQENDWLAAGEICALCHIELEAMLELAELGLLAARRDAAGWQIPATALPRLRVVGRLMHDLGVNVSGAVLAVELLETQRSLERRLRDLERLI
ncbi:MAG: MerR family transcriptional regulator [Gammaproteobacteria bacterium]|nr:MerR family transcriptional regulator [Gammaproteobacteria bacterium]MBV9696902.1 MerR family transcriptional regulator [Gammaproteobacteria bacterium]